MLHLLVSAECEIYLGFSQNKNIPTYQVEDERKKLTIEEMNA